MFVRGSSYVHVPAVLKRVLGTNAIRVTHKIRSARFRALPPVDTAGTPHQPSRRRRGPVHIFRSLVSSYAHAHTRPQPTSPLDSKKRQKPMPSTSTSGFPEH